MPTSNEIKTFQKGVQNRDNDPRVIPDGEYIRLVNGRIARSEASGVGAIENTLGNEAVSTFVDAEGVVLGSIRDQGTDTIYYFIKGSEEDAIYEFSAITDMGRPILRDDRGTLNFNVDFLITGINIIGDGDNRLLLWTDGFNPPRKINIARELDRLNGTLNGFTEQEISVEKNPPLYPPQATSVVVDDIENQDEREELDKEENLKEKFVRFAYRWKYEDNEYSVFSPFSSAGFVPGVFEVDIETGAITGMENRIKALDVSFNTGPREVLEIDLLYKEDNSNIVYIVETFNKADREWNNGVLLGEIVENLFEGTGVEEFNLPDRLREEDPILDVNRGVEGAFNLTTDFVLARGTEEDPDTITITPALSENEQLIVRYYNNAEPIRFSSNKLYRALPSDQLGRVFDNVPIRAKTQEIIQNRIVYGNYVDRYNLEDVLKTYDTIADDQGNISRVLTGTRTEEIVVDINARLSEPITTENFINGSIGERSLKSDRNYELGIVYLDNLGRQTPVLTSENNTVSIPIDRANKINRLSIDINSKAPEWATAYRFFVKQNRGQHFNIIPLEAQIQPDDNRFVWFRIAASDQEKIVAEDYLNIKISNAMFAYLDNDEKIQVRVEEVGPQGRNFLEINPPRTGVLIAGSGESVPEGTVINEGEEYTIQQSGIWMKCRNLSELGLNLSETPAMRGDALGRSNNARGTRFQPIRGDINDYQDSTFYYRGGNVVSDDDITDESSITYAGTYVSGEVRADGLLTGPGSADQIMGAGPMRVEVEVMEGNEYRYSWWLSPSHEEPAVIRQTDLVQGTIPTTISTTPITLVNGVSIVFNRAADDYNVGDRFVATWRKSRNFMWRAFDYQSGRGGGGRIENPNSTSRRGYGARRSHVMFTGAGMFNEGINGRSKIQIGIEDGIGRRLNGNAIAFPYNRNEIRTQDAFYETFEEMMFEEGYWTSGTDPNITGTDRDGAGFGIHQMGFWRGHPITPSNRNTFLQSSLDVLTFLGSPIAALINLFAGDLTEKNAWRLLSAPGEQLLNPAQDRTMEDLDPAPLHGFIQSGTLNSSRNNKKNDLRQTSRVTFTQGQGVDAEMLNVLNVALETVPRENVSDIYFEIGETFPCLNGIHFGNEMSNSQRVMQEIGFNEAGNETQEVSPVPVDLEYFNCYAWSNGIESCTIRDEFNANSLQPGAKASTVVDEYEQRENFSNLIFSSVFNQSTNTNGLNEFSSSAVALGQIIKEMDEQDGSIQHMFSKDTDLTVFQEDKVSRILADKSALFNADGSSNLTSARPVLGQIIPYTGEFGISKDPESFAIYANRMYFTDRNRGAVLRLGQSGIEEISNAGMRDFFRDELAFDYGDGRKPLAIGSYDDYHDEYILSLRAPLPDPTIFQINKPLNISRQAFLSRTDACRYPDEDLQYIEVYEFYTFLEPAGFQIGDIIYTDDSRTSIFLGDNDWFRWDDTEADIDLTSTTDTVDNVQTFEYIDNHINSPMVGQPVTISSRIGTNMDYAATVVSYNRTEEGALSTISLRFDEDQLAGDELMGVAYEIRIDYKFVINIDNFGFVRAKEDCVGITPPNHDAVRVSLSSYSTPEEACGKGLVARVVYHNGDDATPDVGDSIFDTPYASDEFVDGCYLKGRTQKNGWYQMFDGDNFEDFVIRILQGKVVEKRRCAEVMANRSRLLTSENAVQRREATLGVGLIPATVRESDGRLATRVCSMLPTMERFFNGDNDAPILGDTLYDDNFTDRVSAAGFYAIADGNYIQVTSLGVVAFIGRCSTTLCFDDVIAASLLEVQNQESNTWTFLGVNGLTDELPLVTSTEAAYTLDGTDQVLTFNGDITSLGEFSPVQYSWYFIVSDNTGLTERDIINLGTQVGVVDTTIAGPVEEFSFGGFDPFVNVQHLFAAQVEGAIITSDIFITRTLRLENPDAATIVVTQGNLRTTSTSLAMLTATVVAGNNPEDTFTSQWCQNGIDIPGAILQTLSINFMTDPFGTYTYKQLFQGLTVESNELIFVEIIAPTVSILTAFSGDQTFADLTAVAVDDDLVDLTYSWTEVSGGGVIIDTDNILTVTEPGTYEVVVTDIDGLQAIECVVIAGGGGAGQLNNGPIAELVGPLAADVGDTVSLMLTTRDDESTVLTHSFTINGVVENVNLGTGPLTNFVFMHTLAVAPTTYELTVTDDLGASATATHQVLADNLVATSNILTRSPNTATVASGIEVTFTSTVVDDDMTGANYEFFAGGVSQQVGTSNTYSRTENPAIDVTNTLVIGSTYTDQGGLMLDSNDITQQWLTSTPPPAVGVSLGASSVTYSIAAWNAAGGTGAALGSFSVPYSYSISNFVPGFSTSIQVSTSSVNSDGSRSATNIGYLGGGAGGFTANAASGSGSVTVFWRKFASTGPPPIGSITAGILVEARVFDNCTITTVA